MLCLVCKRSPGPTRAVTRKTTIVMQYDLKFEAALERAVNTILRDDLEMFNFDYHSDIGKLHDWKQNGGPRVAYDGFEYKTYYGKFNTTVYGFAFRLIHCDDHFAVCVRKCQVTKSTSGSL